MPASTATTNNTTTQAATTMPAVAPAESPKGEAASIAVVEGTWIVLLGSGLEVTTAVLELVVTIVKD